jgi:glutathione synthase
LLLMLEAQARGHELFYYTPDTLAWRDGALSARVAAIKLFSDPKRYYELKAETKLDLSTMDVVLLRQDPPFNMQYISTTYFLEKLQPKTLVVNDPASVRNNVEKLFPTLLKEFMPPTLITADIPEIEAFRREYKDIVVKPLYGHGGNAVYRACSDDELKLHLKTLFALSKEPIVAQKFLPEVATGDRRIILIDGKFAGIMGRIPAEGEFRANFRLGGTAAKVEITPRQREICEALEPELKRRGIIFAGVDAIGDYLTEVNITSPTGLIAINKLYGKKLEAEIWDAIEEKL